MSTAKTTAGADKSAAETSEQYLTFMLAGEEYGVDILRVQEIKGWDKVTRIPHTPDYVLGVINLRGAVVPILDLRRRFGLETIDFGPTTVVIVVRVMNGLTERTVGVVVDAVSEVYNVDAADSKPPPDVCGSVDTVFVKALATVEEKMLILLDIDRLIGNSIADEVSPGVAAA
ncbi:MAG TPA: chemotaxis protein CheW [Steroidobacteraceae bacterium]|jgi:purine-binding chemotaxis protein CheW|nr:chemotaxis protein CheW [Steroidobacteraceae bacterium]